jgi:hypothetical protein
MPFFVTDRPRLGLRRAQSAGRVDASGPVAAVRLADQPAGVVYLPAQVDPHAAR